MVYVRMIYHSHLTIHVAKTDKFRSKRLCNWEFLMVSSEYLLFTYMIYHVCKLLAMNIAEKTVDLKLMFMIRFVVYHRFNFFLMFFSVYEEPLDVMLFRFDCLVQYYQWTDDTKCPYKMCVLGTFILKKLLLLSENVSVAKVKCMNCPFDIFL